MSQKLNLSIRYWLLGKGYHVALKALEYGAKFHTGTRKDLITPEYNHQLGIAAYIRTLINSLLFPQETLAVAFLHDVCEDYDVGFEEITTKFSNEISGAVKLLTKKHRGEKLSTEEYYRNISKNPIASVVKGADRINNVQTMIDVFTPDKINLYIQETENSVIPMLKSARREFVEQEPVYENIKLVLRSQIELIRAVVKK